MSDVKILVLCSRNQWRSPTAEKLINELPGYRCRSAGTAPSARVRVSGKLVDWADVILVMERQHLRRLRELFPSATTGKTIHCLDIPDDYRFMDNELVDLLRASFEEVLLIS